MVLANLVSQIAPTLTLQSTPAKAERRDRTQPTARPESNPPTETARKNPGNSETDSEVRTLFYNADGVPVVVPFQFHPLAVSADELKHFSQNIARARQSGTRVAQDIRYSFSMIDGRLAISGATTQATFSPARPSEGFENARQGATTHTVHFIDLKGLTDIATTSFLFIRRHAPPLILNDSIPSALRARDTLRELAGYRKSSAIESNLEADARMLELKILSFEALRALLLNMQGRVQPLLQAAAFVVQSAASSDETIIRGNVNNSAALGQVNISVEQRVRPHIVESDTFSNPEAELTSLGGGDLVGSFKINGYTILVDTRNNAEDRDTVGVPGSPYGISPDDFTADERRAVAARMRTLQGIADQINYGLEDLNKNGIIDGPIVIENLGGRFYGFIRVSEDRIVDPNEFRTDYVADADKLEHPNNLDGRVTTNSERIGVRASIRDGRLRIESLDPARRIFLENTSSLNEGNIIDTIGLTQKDGYQIIESDEASLSYGNYSFKNLVQDEQSTIVVSGLTRRSVFSNTVENLFDGLDVLLDKTSRSVTVPVTRTGSFNQGTYTRGSNSFTQYSADTVNESIDDVVRNLILKGVILPTEKEALTYSTETIETESAPERLLGRVQDFVAAHNAALLAINNLLTDSRVLLRDPTLQAIRTDLVRGMEFPVDGLRSDRNDVGDFGLTSRSSPATSFAETAMSTLLSRLRKEGGPGPNVPMAEHSIFAKLSGLGITSLEDGTIAIDEDSFLFEARNHPERIQELFIPAESGGIADRLQDIIERITRPGTGSIDLHLSLLQQRRDDPEQFRKFFRAAGRLQVIQTRGEILTDLLA